MNKKVFLITIYYILGTIGGLYYKNIIPFLVVLFIVNCFIFWRNKKKLIWLTLICIVAFSRADLLYKHVKSVENVENIQVIGDIEQIDEKSNKKIAIIRINKLNNEKVKCKTRIKAYIKNDKLNVGDRISISGTVKNLSYTKNEGCFNYKEYMYSKGIYLNVEADKVRNEKLGIRNYFIKLINNIRTNIKSTFYKTLPERNAAIGTALVIGDKTDLDEDISDSFSEAGLSHIIAISGMHTVYVAYIALAFKRFIGKRKSYILVIIILFLFCNLTNNTESVYRACIMLSLFYLSKILYRKSNSLSNLFISIILGLINNPFCIYSPGFLLSTAGTFGIITINEESRSNVGKIKVYIKNQIKIGLAANIILIPIIAKMYNKVSFTFIISSTIINFFMTILMPVVFIFGIMGVFNSFIPDFVFKIMGIIISFLTSGLLWLADIFKKFSILNVQVVTPSIFSIIIYYTVLMLIYRLRHYNNENIKLNKNKCKMYIKSILIIYLCISLVSKLLTYWDNSLTIYFVDVGQGDCTLIKTPADYTILIDGGGSEDGKDDTVGERIVVPFLLNKHIKKIDYIIISHFDSDHVGGILTVMEKMKVKNVIISKQGEDSLNFRKFIEIVNRKKINVIIAKAGQRINIEKNIYFDIIWPEKELISENILNNNSLVCKLNYNNFSMLFTGDIEEVAESKIVSLYQNNILKATCLKAGHHGSKTSSSKAFLNLVKPQYVLIGVGINNKFGHPNEEIIESYKSITAKIYRTDQDGEIILKINRKGEITIKKYRK